MIDSTSILSLIIGSVAFLVYVYRQISTAALKSKILKLCIRRKNSFKHDSFNECLQDQRNQKLLRSLFYRVNLIDVYVKKVIPSVIFGSVVIMILAFLLMDTGEYKFKIQPNSELTTVSITNAQGDIELLKKEHLVYRTSEGKIIYFEAGTNGIYSLGSEHIMKLGMFVFGTVIAIIVILVLALAYFKNMTSIEEVGESIEEDIRLLKQEVESVENMIKEADIKPIEDYKVERQYALNKKVTNLKESIQEITDMGNQLAKVTS